METNFKGTTGKAYAYRNFSGAYFSSRLLTQSKGIGSDSHEIACAAGKTTEEAEANAQLIADAFNVRQQINVDLPELLKQRDEMIQVLKEIKEWWDSDDIMNDHLPIEKVTDLITKIEQK